MKLIKYYLGYLCSCIVRFSAYYQTQKVKTSLGGGKRNIYYPFTIAGLKNIKMSENVNIGPGATIYTTEARLIIKPHVMIGPNLTIITGDHKFIVERWGDSVKADEKEPFYDQDVIIEEDVWVGSNVTILKGVTIGKSSIIAAGSLVIKDVPPYSIVGGSPAKVLKMKWNEDEIRIHNKFIESNI